MKNNNRFHSYISNHFSHVYGKNIEKTYIKRYYIWKSYLEKFLPKDKTASVLEVGCGMGHNLYSLKRLGYLNVLGFDISKECVDFCNERGLKSIYYKTEKELINRWAAGKKCSFIVLYDVIEHYTPEEAETLLVEVKKILKKNGMVLISVPNAAYPLSQNILYSDITHHFIYNELSMNQLLHTSGMKAIRYVYSNSFSLYDENKLIRLIKQTVILPISLTVEFFWKMTAFSQGIILKNVKPTMYCYVGVD